MKFAIQTSNPRVVSDICPNDATIGEAIESIFPLLTEFAILIWNGVYIPLNYKYDVSEIFDDIVELVTCVALAPEGKLLVSWPSSTFRARWALSWSSREITIHASWDSVIGGTEQLLNTFPALIIDKALFLREWVTLLRKIHTLLLECLGTNSPPFDIEPLNDAIALVDGLGQLYNECEE